MFLKHFCISNSNLLLKPKRRKISQNNFTVVNYLFSISLSASNNISSTNVGYISSDISPHSIFHFHKKHSIDRVKNLKKLTLNKSHTLKKRIHHYITKWDLRMTSNFKVKKKITNHFKAKLKKKGVRIIYSYLKYITHLHYAYSKKYLNIQKILNSLINKKNVNAQKIDTNRNFCSSNQEIVLSEKPLRQKENPIDVPTDTHIHAERHVKRNVKRNAQTEQQLRTENNNPVKESSNVFNKEPNAEWRKFRKKRKDHEPEGRKRKPKRDSNNKTDKVKTSRKNRQDETTDKKERSELGIREIMEKEERFVDEKMEAKGIKIDDLLLVGLSGCIPFICFGFVDNSFMIIAGDLFDSTFCIFLGFSTMAAAGLGNLTSDVLGIFLGGYIEKLIAYIGFPKITMTNKQLKMNRTRRYYYLGSAIGIAIGCLLGMIPLLFIDSHKLEEKKKSKKLKYKTANRALFDLVSNELPHHMNSNHALLFIVDKNNNSFYSYYKNQKIKLALNGDYVLAEVYKKGKTIAYEINNQLINTTYLYKPNINQEEEKIIDTSGRQKKNEREIQIIENTNSFFSKHDINIQKVLAAPLFDIDQSVIAVIVIINPKDPICSNSKNLHFLNLLCCHISHEVKEDTDLSQTLQYEKKRLQNKLINTKK